MSVQVSSQMTQSNAINMPNKPSSSIFSARIKLKIQSASQINFPQLF